MWFTVCLFSGGLLGCVAMCFPGGVLILDWLDVTLLGLCLLRFLLFVSAWLSGVTGFAFRLAVWLVIFVWLGW